MGLFGLRPERSSRQQETVFMTNALILLVVLQVLLCFTFANRLESSANHPVNRKSQSARKFEDRHCPSVNFRELLVLSALFGESARRDNLNEPAKEGQVDKSSGCACSRISLRKQRQSDEKANVSSDKRLMIDQESEPADRPVIQMIVERENRVPDRVTIDFGSDNENMILLNGGEFLKGTNGESAVPTDYEKPARFEYVNAFWLDRFEVSNLEFSFFALSAHYRTDAELLNGSFVFDGLLSAERKMKIKNDKSNYRVAQAPWWLELERASWFRADGDRSLFSLGIQELTGRFEDEFAIQSDSKKSVRRLLTGYAEWISQYAHNAELLRHPVVHVSFDDALNYCRSMGKRLPTENEWEFACKSEAHHPDQTYPWGDQLESGYANLWQGVFPTRNTLEDGYFGTGPVDSFKNQTKSGFKHLIGNVWEWTLDDWSVRRRKGSSKPANPVDQKKVKKGGSFLCHGSYCNRYRCSSRDFATRTTSASNLGFRCARDA